MFPTSSRGEMGLESSKEDEFGGMNNELYFEESWSCRQSSGRGTTTMNGKHTLLCSSPCSGSGHMVISKLSEMAALDFAKDTDGTGGGSPGGCMQVAQ